MGITLFHKYRQQWPPVGMRILKSAAAIELCYLISFLRGNSGILFYSQLAALWCIQSYRSGTRKNALQRMIGTVIGALFGLSYLLIRNSLPWNMTFHPVLNSFMISGMIIAVLYFTVLIRKKQASYFSCVVFLSIVVNHVADASPYLFVWNRFLDTVIGILVGVTVNSMRFPGKKRKDILFLSGLDDTLLNEENTLTDYSRVELNRMLDDGVNFTISTMRTPASLLEPLRDVKLKLPVIAMDGAVLYDIREKRYLKTWTLTSGQTETILTLVHESGLSCFTNVILEDLLIIYYEETSDEIQKKLVQELRRSPLRNYLKRQPPKGSEAIYIMLLYPEETIERFYRILAENGITRELKVLKYESRDYPGYSYIKIYSKNACREYAEEELKKMLQISKTMKFGSVPGKYDEVIQNGDMNRVVHVLRKKYEPLF